jgi:hypothetical protein
LSLRGLRICVSVLFLTVLVYSVAGHFTRWYPQASQPLVLALLLVLTKTAADLLEAPFKARQPTVYYEDLFYDWLRFGLLGVVAVVAHAAMGLVVQGPLPVAPVALGVYGIFYLVRRAS